MQPVFQHGAPASTQNPYYDQNGYPVSQSTPAPQWPQAAPMSSIPPAPQHPTGAHAMSHASQSGGQSMGLAAPEGPPVTASQLRSPGTGLWTGIAWTGLVIFTLGTLGAALGLLALAAFTDWILRRRLRMQIVGSCLRVTPEQLPEVYYSAQIIAHRLGLAEMPEIYILETNTIGSIAARIGGRKMVIVTDDAVDACMRSGDIRTLNFLLAREFAHVALGHRGLIRNAMRLGLPPLSRHDELSADAVAAAIVGQPDIAANALITMLTGPQLLPYVNKHALMQQAYEVAGSKAAKKAEQPMREPLLMRRIARLYQGG
jgi:Zn-dependent protease with chaperone function